MAVLEDRTGPRACEQGTLNGHGLEQCQRTVKAKPVQGACSGRYPPDQALACWPGQAIAHMSGMYTHRYEGEWAINASVLVNIPLPHHADCEVQYQCQCWAKSKSNHRLVAQLQLPESRAVASRLCKCKSLRLIALIPGSSHVPDH